MTYSIQSRCDFNDVVEIVTFEIRQTAMQLIKILKPKLIRLEKFGRCLKQVGNLKRSPYRWIISTLSIHFNSPQESHNQ